MTEDTQRERPLNPVRQTAIGHLQLWLACVVILYMTMGLLLITGAVGGITLVAAAGIGYFVSITPDGPQRRKRIIANFVVALVFGALLVGALQTIEVEGEGLLVATTPGWPQSMPPVVTMILDGWVMALGVQSFIGLCNGIYGIHLGQLERKARACIACGSSEVVPTGEHTVRCSECGYEARTDKRSRLTAADLAALGDHE